MKEWNEKERWELAATLEGIMGADIDLDEVDAIRDAIRLICPEYARKRDEDMDETINWIEHQTKEQIEQYIQNLEADYPASPDSSGTPAAPLTFNGKILRFGEKKDG